MGKLAVQSRMFWLFVLIAHAFGAAAWVALMPRGFPAMHPRFWANVAIPIAIAAAAIVALGAARRGRFAIVRVVLIALAAMWISAAVAGWFAFPISTGVRGLAPLGFGAAVAVSAYAAQLRPFRLSPQWMTLGTLPGIAVGVMLPWLQRAPHPSTRPLNEPFVEASSPIPADTYQPPRTIRTGIALVQPNDGQITIGQDRYVVYVNPLLSFTSRSPDRCWTSLAPRADRIGPRRRLIQTDEDGLLHYADDGGSTLRVDGDGSRVSIAAQSRLTQPVYSHLNTFCEMQIAGHRKLSIAFSPCPDAKIEVLPSDYPVGRPARCAYLGADGVFRAVQASSGEKGPFRELSRGSLTRGEALGITLFDEGRPFCVVTLDDFASQASTDLSPTAGWGLPTNAIEFSLSDERDTSPANLFVTLAGTSVGRGWDSVGHAAGVYRNRMTVEVLSAATPTTKGN